MLKDKKELVGLVFLILAMLLLNSCLMTKKYKAPQAEAQHLFRLDSLMTNGESLVGMPWRTFFKDELLRTYIDSALRYNQENNIAIKNIELFEAQFKRSKAAYLPTLQASAEVSHQHPADRDQYRLNGSFSWELDLWGKITSQKMASKAQFAKSVTAQKVWQTALIANVANTYFQLMAADRRKEVLERTIVVREESLEVLKNMKKAGLSNSLAVAQAEAQLSRAQILLTQNKSEVFVLENNFAELIGKPLKTIERSALSASHFPMLFKLGVPLEILANRPDVKEAELDFNAFFEQHNVARAALYPSLRLGADVGMQHAQLESLFEPGAYYRNLLAGLTAPLFNGRQLRTEKEVARIQLEQSLLRFRKKILQAGVEVSNVMNRYALFTENQKALEKQESLLNQSFEDSRELLKAGLANYLDVLNAQEQLLNTQLEYVRVTTQRMQTATNVYRAVGGGV